MKALAVYLHEHRVGALEQEASGRLAFSYHPGWLSTQEARPLSQSLPLEPRRFEHYRNPPLLRRSAPRCLGTRAGGARARHQRAQRLLVARPAGRRVCWRGDPARSGSAPDYRGRWVSGAQRSRAGRACARLPRRPLLAGT
ncbi:MAG: hypothetical protein HC897_03925, partial [Thermoanaerobaculia bacterium]|nr:hypothetical protein [Thermoanaerobaculia bacterium]